MKTFLSQLDWQTILPVLCLGIAVGLMIWFNEKVLIPYEKEKKQRDESDS